MEFNHSDLYGQIQCVQRELNKRKWVYPKMVSEGKRTKAWADKELSLMEGVLQTLKRLYNGEKPDNVQHKLFDVSNFTPKSEEYSN